MLSCLLRCGPIDRASHTGYFAGSSFLGNNALGTCALQDRNRFIQRVFGLVYFFVGQQGSYSFDCGLGPALVSQVSEPMGFALPCPLKG
jgi:hypothetical protein